MQIRLADIVGKTVQDFFVPADGRAVTFILEEGRMSLGAPVVRSSFSGSPHGCKVTGVTEGPGYLALVTEKGTIDIEYLGATEIVELPE